jgi:hypothetical protein
MVNRTTTSMVSVKAHLQVVIRLTLTWFVSLLLFRLAFVKRWGNDAPWKSVA